MGTEGGKKQALFLAGKKECWGHANRVLPIPPWSVRTSSLSYARQHSPVVSWRCPARERRKAVITTGGCIAWSHGKGFAMTGILPRSRVHSWTSACLC